MSPQQIAIRPSRRLALILMLAHALGAAAVWSVDMTPAVHAALSALIIADLGATLRKYAFLKSGGSITGIKAGGAGEIAVRTHRGVWRTVRLLDTSFVSPYLTILNLKTDDSCLARHAVLVPDNVSCEDFRRFRVWLRWKKPSKSDPLSDTGAR